MCHWLLVYQDNSASWSWVLCLRMVEDDSHGPKQCGDGHDREGARGLLVVFRGAPLYAAKFTSGLFIVVCLFLGDFSVK